MKEQKRKKLRLTRRRRRVRRRVFGTSERPRLSVSRSHKNISVQLIDDIAGRTLCSAGTRCKDAAEVIRYGGNCEAAGKIGQLLAERAETFRRIGNWTEALALYEASLLLDPDREAVRRGIVLTLEKLTRSCYEWPAGGRRLRWRRPPWV